MKVRAITALVLALAAASSSASRYNFSYTGLYYDAGWSDTLDGFYPDRNLTGYFVAEDTNGDGTFQAGELTDFAYAVDYYPGAAMEHVVGPEVPEYCLRCEVTSFDYTPGGTLTFVARREGVRLDDTFSNNGLYSVFYDTYWSLSVTPETIVNVSPVPEPGAGLMFLTGLAGLAYLSKRKAARRQA